MKFLGVEDVQMNTVIKGTGRICNPVVKSLAPHSEKTIIYQPIYREINKAAPELYQSDYVLKHSLDAQNGVGGIFYQRGTSPVTYLSPGAAVNLTPRESSRDIYQMGTLYHDLSNHIIDTTYTYKFATPAVQQDREKHSHAQMHGILNSLIPRPIHVRLRRWTAAGIGFLGLGHASPLSASM
jgi:hypothetical protein